MPEKEDKTQTSILSKALQRHRDDFIHKIITAVNETCLPDTPAQTMGTADQQLLRSRLVDLINDILEKEGVTETREVTILLSDLRGFTAMSENYPAISVIDALNRYFATMSNIIITQYGGTIDKFMGDSIMAIFGVPETRTDDLKRALSCSIHMQIAMDEINQQNTSLGMPPLYMGIGINTGSVVAGKVGSKLHSEYTIIGDEVNLASRIEAYSLRGQILISENVYKQAGDYIKTGNVIQVLAKGKKEPINLYELHAVNRPIPLLVPRRERRTSPRVDIDMPFTYRKVFEKHVLPKKYSGQILNIGYGGLLVTIEEPLEVFSEIRFTLTLSMVGEQNSDVYAKILKICEHEDHYLANIEFTSINVHAKVAVKSFIDRIIQGL